MPQLPDAFAGPLAAASLPALAQLGPSELVRRRGLAQRLAEDEGVVVGIEEDGQPRHLAIDPLPLVIEAAEWAELERGLAQRAALLDLVLADVYGPRNLVTRGLLAPQLLIGHPGFLPQAVGVPTRHGLFLTAVDLGRNAAGDWCAVADRTQAPVGAGYAMAVRRITARALATPHRDTDLRRLRGFFDVMRTGLQEKAVGSAAPARVAVLTAPEPGESTCDEVFTATLMGLPVVRAEDLALREGRVWLRTTEKPEPVDVIVRRVDADRADPLELPAGSGEGLPGLLEATRRGAVSVVNPIGAGVLENPALAAFLPAICRALTGEDLILPSAGTWWCGDDASRRYVEDNLGDLQLAPLSPTGANPRVFVGELSGQDRAALWERVEAEPWAWSAQEVLPRWAVPVVTEEGLSSRMGLLRTFALADAHGVVVMPGGLARLPREEGNGRVPPLTRAVTKDVWVLADEATKDSDVRTPSTHPAHLAVPTPEPRAAEGRRRQASDKGVPLSRGAAEDLYWFGRYAERAESTARLLSVADDLVEDHIGRPGTDGFEAMQTLMDAIDALTSVHRDQSTPSGSDPAQPELPTDPVPHLRTLLFDASRRGTVHYASQRAARAAARVRELLSADSWLVIGRLDRTLGAEPAKGDQLQSVLATVIESFLAIAGIGAEGLVRDASWAFYDAGRRVERSQETVRLLARTVAPPRTPAVDALVLEAVLRARESVISHRRRTAESGPERGGLEVALDLLLADPTNPRAVVYQLDRLREDLGYAPSITVDGAIDGPTRLLDSADIPALSGDPAGLQGFLGDLENALRRMSATIDATSFRHPAPQQVFQEPR